MVQSFIDGDKIKTNNSLQDSSFTVLAFVVIAEFFLVVIVIFSSTSSILLTKKEEVEKNYY
jgi:hypothetical protein